MKNITLRFLSVFLLFFSIMSWSYNAQAIGEWTSPDIIDTANNPLEIAGGLTFNQDVAFNTFIVLNAGTPPLKSLQVYNVDVNIRGCSLANQSNLTDFDGPLFGIGHRVVGTVSDTDPPNTIFYTSVIDNFTLKVIRSDDAGQTWAVVQVSPNQVYESSEIAVDPDQLDKVYAGGCNHTGHTYDIYRQDSFGSNNFQLAWQIPNVDCAFSDLTIRSTFNVFYDQSYVFFGRDMGGGMQDIIINRGNGDEVIDMDLLREANSVIEVYNPTLIDTTGYIVTPYYNKITNMVKLAGSVKGLLDPIVVQDVGPASNFTTFFGIGCVEFPTGTANIIWTGGNHVQINTNTKETFQVDSNGNFENLNGPVATSTITGTFEQLDKLDGFGPNIGEINRETLAHIRGSYMGNSIGCGEFILPSQTSSIPTLSEWGLIAMAGVLGIIAFMVLRRRKVTA